MLGNLMAASATCEQRRFDEALVDRRAFDDERNFSRFEQTSPSRTFRGKNEWPGGTPEISHDRSLA
jgi:hypothetical protein